MSRTIKTQKIFVSRTGSIKKSHCPVPRNTGPVLPINNEQSLSGTNFLTFLQTILPQWDPAYKKPLFENESEPVSNTMRPLLC